VGLSDARAERWGGGCSTGDGPVRGKTSGTRSATRPARWAAGEGWWPARRRVAQLGQWATGGRRTVERQGIDGWDECRQEICARPEREGNR
jgi:hypothetical protein